MADKERQEEIRRRALSDLDNLHHAGYLGVGTPPKSAEEYDKDGPPDELEKLDAGWLGLALRITLGAAVMVFLVWLLLIRLTA
jgi:hypothetical protein